MAPGFALRSLLKVARRRRATAHRSLIPRGRHLDARKVERFSGARLRRGQSRRGTHRDDRRRSRSAPRAEGHGSRHAHQSTEEEHPGAAAARPIALCAVVVIDLEKQRKEEAIT